MILVLDSSVAFKWFVPEVDSDKALRVRDDIRAGIFEIIAPDFFPTELAHSLTRAERQRRIAVGDAARFWSDAMTTPPLLFPEVPLLTRAIDISSSARTGVYDCVYVALAEQEMFEFLTADDLVVKNLGAQFPLELEATYEETCRSLRIR